MSLHHLERIVLTGALRGIFPILRRLEFPKRMDHGEILFRDCTSEKISRIIGPWIRDYLRRDVRFRDKLGIFTTCSSQSISLHASVIGAECHGPDQLPQHGPPYGKFTMELFPQIHIRVREQLYIYVLALLPRGYIVSLRTHVEMKEEVATMMPNLEFLHLFQPVVLGGFLLPDPNGPNAGKKLFPSLRRLYLESAEPEDDWGPLIAYLAHQMSGSDRTLSLNLLRTVHVCPGVIRRMENLVKELVYIPGQDRGCPFDKCQ